MFHHHVAVLIERDPKVFAPNNSNPCDGVAAGNFWRNFHLAFRPVAQDRHCGLAGSTFAITGFSAGTIPTSRNPLRTHHLVSGTIGRASTVIVSDLPFTVRSIVIGMVSPSLRTMRH